MVLTQECKNQILTNTSSLFSSGGVGLNSENESVNDTGLFGGGTIIDACDATTGWTTGGDASSVALNTSSGYFVEGTGCINMITTYSAGSANFYKTISDTDLTGKKLYLWFYIDDATDLISATDAVIVDLGTGGFTDYSSWNYSNNYFSNGWNSIYVNVSSPSSLSGSGLTTSTTNRLRLNVKLDSSQAANDMRMDYWRSYEPGTLGVSDSNKKLIVTVGTNYFKTTMNLTTTESNGFGIVECGDNDGSSLLSRTTFAEINKGFNTQVQIDKYYYID